MKPFPRLFQSGTSITKKLLFMNLMIFIVFGIITGIMLMTFHNIEDLMVEVMEKNVSDVMANAQTGKALSSLFDKTHLLISTFYREDNWQAEGEFLLEKTDHLSLQTTNREMGDALRSFKTNLALLLGQCLAINTVSKRIETIDENLAGHFAKMGDGVSEKMITLTTEEEDTPIVGQVSVLITSCRETLLKASFQFVRLEPMRTDTRDTEPIVMLLGDLSLKVRTLLASGSELRNYENRLLDSISEYQGAIMDFNNAIITFRERLFELNAAREDAIRVMRQTDDDMLRQFELMQKKAADVMRSSIRFVYLISGTLIILFGILTYIFFLLNIRRPMERIREGLEAISDGDMDTQIQLNRNDEWSLIEDSVNRMVSEVWHSYGELYRKNEELQKMHEDLEASMKHLEIEISERRQAEEELRRTQGYIKNIIDSMPSVMIGVDHNGRITHWNMAAERAVGIKAEDTRGRPVTDVYPDLASQLNHIRRSLRRREPVKAEKQIRHKENEIRYEDIMIYPLVANGVEGAVIRIDDVTSRVRIEEMMIQTEKMMSVGGLAAGMAHEINNPLGVILQGVQNSFRRLSPELEVNVKTADACGTDMEAIRAYLKKRGIFRYLNGIKNAGTRAARIVTNMLNFSQSGGVNMISTDINKLLDDTVELAANDYDLKREYDFRHIEIIRDYDEDLGQIPCTPTEIEQVILNLLKNAAHAMAEKTVISQAPSDSPDIVSESDSSYLLPESGTGNEIISTIILRTRREDKHARSEIQDNGPGMDGKTCKRIFEPFYTTKRVGMGTGLGLSVSYFIVTNNHEGSLSVESELGRGTKFVIHLPFQSEG